LANFDTCFNSTIEKLRVSIDNKLKSRAPYKPVPIIVATNVIFIAFSFNKTDKQTKKNWLLFV